MVMLGRSSVEVSEERDDVTKKMWKRDNTAMKRKMDRLKKECHKVIAAMTE